MSTARRYWLVGFVILIFVTALGASAQIIIGSLLDEKRVQAEITWAAAQLQIDFLQLQQAYSGYAGVTRSVPASYLEQRLSFFRNRIRDLKEEAGNTDFADNPVYGLLITELEATVAAGSPVTTGLQSEDPALRRAAVNKLARLDGPIRSWVQDVMLNSDESPKEEEFVTAPMKAAGVMGIAIAASIAMVILLLRNIRGLEVAHEREREARWRIDQASRVKDTFLAVVTHELRTPLNAVIGFSELMKTRINSAADRELATWIDEVLNAGRHLLTLINQTLDMSKIAAGKLALSPSEFDLRLMIEDSVAGLKRQMAVEDIARLGEGAPRTMPVPADLALLMPAEDLMIRADEAWLRQALLNVILHARKTSTSRAAITIAAETQDGRAVIEVSNQASEADGTFRRRADDERRADARSEEAPTQALDPFVQGKLGLSRETYGLGLELPIAKAIVEAHEGNFHYEATADHLRLRMDIPLNLAA